MLKQHKIKIKEVFSILGLFISWRVSIQLIAWLSTTRLNLLKDQAYPWIQSFAWAEKIPSWLSYWTKWDSGWYLSIAERGYFWDGPHTWSSVVFFPFYPVAIRFLAKIIQFFTEYNFVLAGLIISNLALLFSCFYIYRLVRCDFDKRKAFRAVFYLLIFPTSVFLASLYTESLFLLLCLASFYYARQQKWITSSICGGLAALTKPLGVFLFFILLFEYLEQRKFNLAKIKASVFSLFLTPFGLLLFMSHLYDKFKNPFLFIFAQESWGRKLQISEALTFTWQNFKNLISKPSQNMAYLTSNLFDYAFLFLFFVLAIFVFLLLRKSYGLYMLLGLFIPLTTGQMLSMSRYVLILFPAFIFLALLGKNKVINYTIVILFSMLSSLFITMFVNSYWVG